MIYIDTEATSSEPAGYPWPPLQGSCLITADAVVPVRVDDAGGHWTAIDAHLAAAGAAPMAQRQAVLAIGSNRSLVALRRKYAPLPGWIIPTLNVAVAGIGVSHAACVSGPGWIPWAPLVADSRQWFRYAVSFVDNHELALLDSTEPNYVRRLLPPVHTVQLENGDVLDGVHLYCSRHGLITGEDGMPVPAGTQREALQLAAAALGQAVTHAQLAASACLREQVRVAFTPTAAADGLAASAGPAHGNPGAPGQTDVTVSVQ